MILKRNWIEYLSVLIFSLGSGLILLFQLYFTEVFHFSIMQSAILLAMASGGQLSGSLLGKKYINLVDFILKKYNKLTISPLYLGLVILSFAAAILLLLLSFNKLFFLFVVLCFLLGFVLALFYPPIQTIFFEGLSVKQAMIANAFQRWAVNLGMAISLTLLSFSTHHPKILFLSLSFAMLISTLLLSRKLNTKQYFDKIKKAVLIKTQDLVTTKNILLWGAGVFLGVFIFFQTISAYPMYLFHHYGIGSSLFSRLMLINILLVLTLQFFVPLLERVMSIHLIAAVGILLMGFGMAVVAFHFHYSIILSFIVWSVGEIMIFGAAPVYIKIFAGADDNKSLQYSTCFYFLSYLAKMIGPFIGGILYDGLQGSDMILVGILSLSVISVTPFLIFYLQRERLFPEGAITVG